jgi:hypothetical protein
VLDVLEAVDPEQANPGGVEHAADLLAPPAGHDRHHPVPGDEGTERLDGSVNGSREIRVSDDLGERPVEVEQDAGG